VSPRSAPDTGGRGGRVAVTVLVVAGAAIVMLFVARAQPKAAPFDPDSGGPDGARALVLLLREQGAVVDVVHAAPAAGAGGRVLVLDDRLDFSQRDELLAWVRAGGVAVVADPSSPLHGGTQLPTEAVRNPVPTPAPDRDVQAEIDIDRGGCTIAALEPLRGVFVRDGLRFAVADDVPQCFSGGGFAFTFTRPTGSGVIVALGDNRLFTNALIRYADNGPLATALLAPQRGAVVHILVGSGPSHAPSDVGTGDQTLADLVRPGVWMALLQLGIAFVLFAVARGIRPGRPVSEPLTAPVAGSELVVATGNLMQRARHAQRAAWVLRYDTYRRICHRFDVPPTTSIADLDALAVERSGLLPGELAAALADEIVAPDQLVDVANRLSALRDRTLEGASR
jgi:hypothetical protein